MTLHLPLDEQIRTRNSLVYKKLETDRSVNEKEMFEKKDALIDVKMQKLPLEEDYNVI